MRLNVVVIVWGESYIQNFCRYALPSLLSPRNLPALADLVATELRIYTRKNDLPTFASEMNGALTEKLDKTLKWHYCELPLEDYSMPTCAAQDYAQRRIIEDIAAAQEAVLFCAPDVMRSDGSLEYIGKNLRDGKIAVFMFDPRVVQETIVHEVSAESLMNGGLDHLSASRLMFKHIHPTVGALHYKSERCLIHIDYFIWPVGNEGMLLHFLAHTPICHIPHKVNFVLINLVSDENDPASIEASYSSNNGIGLSLSPLVQCMNWIEHGGPASPMKFGQFMCRHHASSHGLRQPISIPIVEHPTKHLWDAEFDAERAYFKEVIRCRDEVLHGVVQQEPGINLVQTYNEELHEKRIDLLKSLLHWVPGDCATIRYLDRLVGDGW